ncbi:MAG TPA: exopolyphosphatase [Ruminococcaceae bacterium]|mgnify:FL=1|jgi:phosphoesterase RecJ-like protein|nr:exopolyphosphatase [Oscillospiraceae bacterium]HBQ46605.1 exopolyphosphatase [Oscillospiraceae bacterium]
MGSLDEAAAMLRGAQRVVILSHKSPDGDTLGAASALCRALRRLGKRAAVRCSDPIGPKYRFLFEGLPDETFEPDLVAAVDIADEKLFGEPLLARYGGKVDLCVDHHPSNTGFARLNVVNPKAAAACEVIFALLKKMGAPIDRPVALALYTGITTDTGCFKYTNVTPATYRIAADLVETGIDAPAVNRAMFDTKSRARLEMERRVLDSIRYECGGKVALIKITKQMVAETGATEDDLDGLASIPREIEGVLVGVTLREKGGGEWKVSLRARDPANASQICAKFGGGGHRGAAGCSLRMPPDEAERRLLAAVRESLAAGA